MVTHRIPAIMDFDLIVVLQNGEIIGTGTHQQLSERDGLYKSLYENEVVRESLAEG